MNIPQAIKVLDQERSDHHSFPTDIIGQAEALAIEALIGIQEWRIDYNDDSLIQLPGETED